MRQWILLGTAAELAEKIQELKRKCAKRILCNYWLSDKQINEEIVNTEFFYMEEDDNLTIIKRWDDFYQMYYFIGNLDGYSLNLPVSADSGTLVCELIEKENKEKQKEVIKKLDSFGFKSYKKYYLWEHKCTELARSGDKRLTFIETCEYGMLADMYEIFDHYSERLPLLRDFESFCARMGRILCWDKDEYVGAVIYSVNQNVATEEFIYIVESARGKGYAKALENQFVSYCTNVLHLKRIYAWIETNNVKSIALHQSAGYLKTDQYKLTLKRGHED